ncbi:hypothetical protein Tc00.1047053508165.380 [Trypanosoma cruzi]|uniref:Surface protease GP63 n=1 Tax=Trypanosoma cruzi (strain CL Brener) TaxID=353153 RepID=Q4E1J6_TRYCC|nr:hypothetical protein Tc00.1047053508165.380 [Trypanosoma cruzi]EAN98643.1 hypothetical protein Tc00.1047053508165.380 [Trypanosoma cruzi]|eukprot:XP_820494.1 hypothetical protein [Trypanosoma cruzi strain CL Brener]
MSAKRPMDSFPVTDPAVDVRDADAVIWRRECLSVMPGDETSSWCLDTLPTNTTDARDPEDTYLIAALHAALRCPGMQVRLRVVEKGNVRWVSCTDGATITWATRPYDEGNAIRRDHAEACRISATAGSLLPVVPCDGEERACGAGRFHRHLLNKDCEGHPSLLRRALRPAAAPHRRMLTRLHRRRFRRPRRGSRPRCSDGNGVISPSDTAGAPQEALKKSDLPCNDDVAADGVTSVVGQPAGDGAASDRAGGGATTTGPKGPDAAQGAVDPPPSDDDAAVGAEIWRQT